MEPLLTRFIRIYPDRSPPAGMGLRLELLGCEVEGKQEEHAIISQMFGSLWSLYFLFWRKTFIIGEKPLNQYECQNIKKKLQSSNHKVLIQAQNRTDPLSAEG